MYDRVSISLHGDHAQTNFCLEQYAGDAAKLRGQLAGLSREELQRSLGVKPMDKSSRFRGVSKKKGKWEAKVMLNRKWAYRGDCPGSPSSPCPPASSLGGEAGITNATLPCLVAVP